MLVLLYYLSQNPNFAESVRPLMNELKNSEQMLDFLNNLSKFSKTFSTLQNTPPEKKESPPASDKAQNQTSKTQPHGENAENAEKKNPQSPTKGIADEFIQNILDSYLKNQTT